MIKYKKLRDGYIRRLEDLALIPPSNKNEDYKNYQSEVAVDGTIEEQEDAVAIVKLTQEEINAQKISERQQAVKDLGLVKQVLNLNTAQALKFIDAIHSIKSYKDVLEQNDLVD